MPIVWTVEAEAEDCLYSVLRMHFVKKKIDYHKLPYTLKNEKDYK